MVVEHSVKISNFLMKQVNFVLIDYFLHVFSNQLRDKRIKTKKQKITR
jgi:hypothetical protein